MWLTKISWQLLRCPGRMPEAAPAPGLARRPRCCRRAHHGLQQSPGASAQSRQLVAHCRRPADGRSSTECRSGGAGSPRLSEEARHLGLNVKSAMFKCWRPIQTFLERRAGRTGHSPLQQGPRARWSPLTLMSGFPKAGAVILSAGFSPAPLRYPRN